MSGIKGVFKDGWQPKGRDGGKESWRGDFKGINQVAGWMGKGKDRDSERAEHVSRPLSSLKDPASFGPPPKHINYHGPAAVPNQITPDRSGLGAPLSSEQIQQQNARVQEAQAEAEEAANKPAAPALPYRADRTGLTTDHLPPPPVRRLNSPASPASPAKPSVPPRIPPRTNSIPPPSQSPSPPPAYSAVPASQSPSEGYLNQGATSRLAQAGVSVPALGIGSGSSPSPTTGVTGQEPVNELQSRFAHMSTNSSGSSERPPPAQGTTLVEKQAALRTAQNFHHDPSSLSVSDARSAAGTASNFRERHSDQIQAGRRKLSGLNEKYGISKRINSFMEEGKAPANPTANPAPPPPPPHPNRSSSNIDLEALHRRKAPPPPPPPKKASMRASPVSTSPTPPPLPLGTKPR